MSSSVMLTVIIGGVFALAIVVILLVLGRMKTYRDVVARVALAPGQEARVACVTGEPPTWLWLEFSFEWDGDGRPYWELQMRMVVELDGKVVHDGAFELRANSGVPFERRGVLGFGGGAGRGLKKHTVTGASLQLGCFDVPAQRPVSVRVTATPAFPMDRVDLAVVVGAGEKGVLWG